MAFYQQQQRQPTLAGKAKSALANAKSIFNSTLANAQSTFNSTLANAQSKFNTFVGENKEDKNKEDKPQGATGVGGRRRRSQKRGRKSRHHKKRTSRHHKKRSVRRHRGSRRTRRR